MVSPDGGFPTMEVKAGATCRTLVDAISP